MASKEEGIEKVRTFLGAALLFASKVAIEHLGMSQKDFMRLAGRAYRLSEAALDGLEDEA